MCIGGINHIIPALHAVYGNPDVARATHNIYAYRCEYGGKMVSYYNDGGEYGAGRRILQMMEDNDISDRLICVSRWYGGSHMGPSRFDSIMDIAKQVIDRIISCNYKSYELMKTVPWSFETINIYVID